MDDILNQDYTPPETINIEELNEFVMQANNETKEIPYFKALSNCLDLINSSDKIYDQKGMWTCNKASIFARDLLYFSYDEKEDLNLRKQISQNNVATWLLAGLGVTGYDFKIPISIINKNHHALDDLLKILYNLCITKSCLPLEK